MQASTTSPSIARWPRANCARTRAITLHHGPVTNTLVFRDHNHALASFDLAGQTIAKASA
jgi:hypothetical protein